MLPVVRRNFRSLSEDPFQTFRDRFTRFLADWPAPLPGEFDLLGDYPVDIREEVDAVLVEAELPGFTKDQIDVQFEDNVLSIDAERKPEETKGKSHLHERRYTRVERAFRLPSGVDESKVDAKFENGVLYLRLKKRKEQKGRRIEVS